LILIFANLKICEFPNGGHQVRSNAEKLDNVFLNLKFVFDQDCIYSLVACQRHFSMGIAARNANPCAGGRDQARRVASDQRVIYKKIGREQ
jgi:hypothetical protein